MQIVSETHLAPILAPLPGDGQAGVGRPVEDSADYAWLDEEMMKVGSLQHGEVDWVSAETRAVRLLSEVGKDLKVLGHLLHCLQRDGNGVRFALSLRLLAGSLGQWWCDAYPFAGGCGAKWRPRLFQQFTQRAVALAAALDFKGADDEYRACRTSLNSLVALAKSQVLPDAELDELRRAFEAARPDESPGSNSALSAPTPPAAQGAVEVGVGADPQMPKISLEAGNERGNRQALLKMADFLNEQAPGDALGYRLRRHAIWHAIQALPATRDGVRTELAPVSPDRAADYRDMVARGGDLVVWRRIENSLAVSPYWLEGHRLSASLAAQLGHERCADAIRDEAGRFVARLEGIEVLTFNDGSPFVDTASLDWLHSTPASGMESGHASTGEPWQAGLAEAREQLVNKGLEAALQHLDQGLASSRSPRDSVYWRLASAELLRDAGLEALARQYYLAIQHSVTGIALEQWEPALLSRLEAAFKR